MSAASGELNGLETGRLCGITKQQDDQKCEDLLGRCVIPGQSLYTFSVSHVKKSSGLDKPTTK